MYTMTLEMFLRTPFISPWKLAGHPSKPIGEVIHWYYPWPGIVNAVKGCDFLSSCICQNPDAKSSVENIVKFARPMSPMHSVISSLNICLCESDC
jgi:hypothetical protein